MKKKILLGLGACCMVCLIMVAFTSSKKAADTMITVSGIIQSQKYESLSGANVDVVGDPSLSQKTNTKGVSA